MTTVAFKKIFHPSDFSNTDTAAWLHAVILALKARGKLTLLHVTPEKDSFNWDNFPHIRPVLAKWGYIEEGAPHEAVGQLGLDFRKLELVGQTPALSIIDYLKTHQQHLIVLSTHQTKGLSRWVKENEAEPIASHSKAPTLFIPRNTHGFINPASGEVHLDKILVPVCKHPDPWESVEAAVSLASQLDCTPEIHCVYVGDEADAPELEVPSDNPFTLHYNTIPGTDPVSSILAFSESIKSNLIVMATDGPQGFLDGLRGTTAQNVLRSSQCPVLMINSRDFN